MKQILVELNTEKTAALQTEPIRREWEKGIYGSMLIHTYSGLSEESYTSRFR